MQSLARERKHNAYEPSQKGRFGACRGRHRARYRRLRQQRFGVDDRGAFALGVASCHATEGGSHRSERNERPCLHTVDVQRTREPEVVRAPDDLGFGERVRRVRRSEHHPRVRVQGLQPHRRPWVTIRVHDRATGTPIPEGRLRVGNCRSDVRAQERFRVRGILE